MGVLNDKRCNKGFDANLLVIPHAGEFGNTETMCANLKDTISYVTKRIGHGVSILECNANNVNPDNKKLVLDISISSNMKFITDDNAQPKYKSLIDHPIKELIENNYTVTLSTDDPAILFNSDSNITLNDEYKLFATLYDQPFLKLYHITKIASDGFKNIPLEFSDGSVMPFLKELQQTGHTELIKQYFEFQTKHIKSLIK